MNRGNFLFELRKSRGLSQNDIALFLGYSPQLISLWEKDKSSPDLVIISKYASKLDIDLDGFINCNDTKNNDNCDSKNFDIKSFSIFIKKLRKENGLLQNDVAKKIGVNVKSVSAWENMSSTPSIEQFVALSKLFNLSYDELYFCYKNDNKKVGIKPHKRKKKKYLVPLLVLVGLLTVGGAATGITFAIRNNRSGSGDGGEIPPIDTYIVTWENYDGTVLDVESYNYGETPTYKGSTPTREKDAQYTYSFDGWSPSITKVTQDIVYKAEFSESTNQYTVTWKNYDGTILDVETYSYGDTPSYKGETPMKEKDAQYTYSFAGWSPSITKVTQNVTYSAEFSESTNQYTVTWKNYDGSVLDVETYSYGDTPSYKGETPTRENDDQYTYVFSNWSPDITTVTENATYFAEYSCKTDIKDNLVIDKVANKAVYGYYPQTKVIDQDTIDSLNNISEPSIDNKYLLNNDYYEKYNNSWYKCDEIRWIIIANKDNEYTLVSEKLLDVKSFYHSNYDRTIDDKIVHAANYEYSEIRQWLNNDFYQSAFFLHNSHINSVEIDNSPSTTDSDENPNCCSNTIDKVFLLSYQEYSSLDVSIKRARHTTLTIDKGAYNDSGYGYHWTRSPSSSCEWVPWCVDQYGNLYTNYGGDVTVTNCGVRPCIVVKV